ncbi:hypothetical protein CHS0354_005930, partial [Potamilus streckersoni]
SRNSMKKQIPTTIMTTNSVNNYTHFENSNDCVAKDNIVDTKVSQTFPSTFANMGFGA